MSTGKPTDVVIRDVELSFESVPYRSPLKFGGRIVSDGWLMNTRVTVENTLGKTAHGYGSMPLGNVWAWPSALMEPPQTEAAMRLFAERTAKLYLRCQLSGHPMELEHHLRSHYQGISDEMVQEKETAEAVPVLARLVAASPFDAALHDAWGRLLGINSFNGLSAEYCNADLSHYLDDRFAGEYADQYTLREPVPSLPLYHLVGALDPLTEADVINRPNDQLPVTLGEWIEADQLSHLKIKLNGDALDWDVERVLAIERESEITQTRRGCNEWFYSCDFNEKCDSAEYVVDFLRRIEAASPAAFARIQYIEQPTSRHLDSGNAPNMHAAAAIRPVVIDEALVSWESLLMAREQGYSGIALKACKGQSESIAMAAAAQKFGMFLCVQDLTCPGASFMHSSSLSAHIPGVAAVEGNSRQYCPSANAEWQQRYPELFTVKAGRIQTSGLNGPGLGFRHLREESTDQ